MPQLARAQHALPRGLLGVVVRPLYTNQLLLTSFPVVPWEAGFRRGHGLRTRSQAG